MVWLLALVVLRVLFASEDAAQGSGVLAVLLTLSAGVLLAIRLVGGHAIHYRFCWVDAGVTALVAVVLASVSVAAERHAAINLAWEWIAVGMVYWLVRLCAATADRARIVLVMVVAAAGCAGAYGVYQVGVDLPRLRAQYQRNPTYYLARQQPPIVPGSVRQEQFEYRLYSDDACGPFALANSLAGLLVLALPIGLGMLASTRGRLTSLNGRVVWGLLAVVLAILCVALILTRSRSAYVALAVALVWTIAGYGRAFWRRHWKLLGAAVLFVVVAAGAAVATGWVDRLVLAETGKSLRYRLEYWQGACQIVREHPWRGVGPGNFGTHYQRYKLPGASEEVQDPHNAVLELWSTSGVGAALLWVATVAGFVVVTTRRGPNPDVPRSPDVAPRRSYLPHAVLAAALAVGAVELFFPVGWSEQARPVILLALLGSVAVGAKVAEHLHADDALHHAVVGGVLGLALHLMAAGGISYPAVATPWWCAIAAGIGLTQARAGSPRPVRVGPKIAGVVLIALVALTGLFSATWCWPHVRAGALKAQAIEEQAQGRRDRVERHWRRAASLVPSDPEPWRALAGHYVRLWRARSGADQPIAFTRAEDAFRQVIRRDPDRSAAYRDLGLLYMARAGRGDRASMTQALDALRTAVRLYPNNAGNRVCLSQALWMAGDRTEARRQAQRAVHLDDLMIRAGHVDKTLSAGDRAVLDGILSIRSPRSAPSTRPGPGR